MDVTSDWLKAGMFLDAFAQAPTGEARILSASQQIPAAKVPLVAAANFGEPGVGTEKGPVLRDWDLLFEPPRTALSVPIESPLRASEEFRKPGRVGGAPAQLFLATTAPGSQDG